MGLSKTFELIATASAPARGALIQATSECPGAVDDMLLHRVDCASESMVVYSPGDLEIVADPGFTPQERQ